jgi:glycosyltransferase involved in cell wall biosynthesis
MAEKVTIIVPAHNEELYIGTLLPSLQKLKGWKTPEFEVQGVVVIDDGSQDRTAEIARKAGFQVIRLEKNYGKTFAFYKGARFARKNGSSILVTLDADLQAFTMQQLRALLRPVLLKQCPMTIGSRKNDSPAISGDRAIRTKSLEPLFMGNSKFEDFFGIRKGRFVRRVGFGLEAALNDLLGYDQGRCHIVEIDCVTQRPFGRKKLASGKFIDYNAQIEGEIQQASQRARDRNAIAGYWRELRKGGGVQARKEHRAQKQRPLR